MLYRSLLRWADRIANHIAVLFDTYSVMDVREAISGSSASLPAPTSRAFVECVQHRPPMPGDGRQERDITLPAAFATMVRVHLVSVH
jgi:hypothetical protein